MSAALIWTTVRFDLVTGDWRVKCPVHGELGRFRGFWPASREARQHNEACPGEEEAEPDAVGG